MECTDRAGMLQVMASVVHVFAACAVLTGPQLQTTGVGAGLHFGVSYHAAGLLSDVSVTLVLLPHSFTLHFQICY
eukprot:SAG31_NODE_7094_length_1790_cov_1.259018_2_plen_75_part_00